MSKELSPVAELNETAREFARRVARGEAPNEAGRALGLTELAHHNLLRQSAIVWAIRVERQRLLSTEGASLGYKVLMDLARDESVQPAVRRSAAKDLLNLGGHVPPKAEFDTNSHNNRPLSEMSSDELRALVDKLDSELADRAKPISDAASGASGRS